uniref:Mutator-like transposase domain-containing protein n=1 Tax=Trichogramma kaykai TaxID=54128 RepID=A0ABD2X0J3_9HYME
MLERALCCVTCKGKVKLSEQSIRGLGFQINVKFSDCQRELSVDSSQKIGTMSNAYDINRRSVLMIRALGHGHTGLETLCGLMDTLPPVTQSHFDTINSQLCQASKSVADFSMREAVKEELNATEGEEVATLNDGKRGLLDIMKEFDLYIGENAVNWANKSNETRYFHAERATQASTKEARVERRSRRRNQKLH